MKLCWEFLIKKGVKIMTVYELCFDGWGMREIEQAKELLVLFFKDHKLMESINNLKIGFNDESGYVFLFDGESYDTYMENNGKLEQWLCCSYCGNEGFKEDVCKEGTDICGNCERDIFTGEFPDDE
jgi:hypothetical protein